MKQKQRTQNTNKLNRVRVRVRFLKRFPREPFQTSNRFAPILGRGGVKRSGPSPNLGGALGANLCEHFWAPSETFPFAPSKNSLGTTQPWHMEMYQARYPKQLAFSLQSLLSTSLCSIFPFLTVRFTGLLV